MSQMNQSQVPDGMVANVPWGTPLERWTDRMIERGLTHLDSEGEGTEMFPRLCVNGRGGYEARHCPLTPN
jgi:hypothetical protein